MLQSTDPFDTKSCFLVEGDVTFIASGTVGVLGWASDVPEGANSVSSWSLSISGLV